MRGLIRTTIIAMFVLLVCVTDARAAVVGEAQTGTLTLFIQGVSSGDATAAISGIDSKITSSLTLEEAAIPVNTLFLVDISTSVRNESRTQVFSVFSNLLESKKDGDTFALSTVGEDHTQLTDFTADRYEFDKAVESLEWTGMETNIYSALHTAVELAAKLQAEGQYVQIVVFSDGIEDSSAGITKDELYILLEKYPVPIHTVGFQYENNSEVLKEYHSFARLTGGLSLTVPSDSDPAQTAAELSAYADGISAVTVEIPERLRDGAVRPLEITGPNGEVIYSGNITMPMATETVAPSPKPTETPTASPSPAPTTSPVPSTTPAPTTKPQKKYDNMSLFFVIGVIILVLLAAAFLAAKRLKKKAPVPESKPSPVPNADLTEPLREPLKGFHSGYTDKLIPDNIPKKSAGVRIVLNDIEQTHKRFEAFVSDSGIIVGRSPEESNVVIDYDKKMSRKHYRITAKDGELFVKDLDSTNHCYVNKERLSEERKLSEGDIITSGKTKLSVHIEKE